MERPPAGASARGYLLTVALPVVVFLYFAGVRTYGISRTFWLFGDQTLYWRIALGSWRDLPMGGGPSQVGGTTIGPIFCWTLWAFRHLIGPFTSNLPHAGGIGLSLLQSAADALLFAAIWKRFASLPLALAVVLIAGSAPYDMALSATIWNPPLAVAFAKAAIACVLFGERRRTSASTGWSLGATACAVLATQAHSSGLFFAAPVVASFTLREVLDRNWARATRMAILTAATVFVLEVPYLADRLMQPERTVRPVAVASSVSYTLAHPESLRPAAAFRALTTALNYIIMLPWSLGPMALLILASAALTLFRARSDVTIACVTVLPLVAAVAGFSFWQNTYDNYWYLVLAPGACLMVGLAVTAWPPSASMTAAALLLLALAAQPARIADSRRIHRLPEYDALVRGARDIRRYTPEVRAIGVDFDLPAGVDYPFLHAALGGTFSPTARFDAIIHKSGDVTFPLSAFAPSALRQDQ